LLYFKKDRHESQLRRYLAGAEGRLMRPPITLCNATVQGFLEGYFSASEACQAHLWLDDILSGVLALRSGGDSRTRALSRKVLFLLLQRCNVISTKHAKAVLQQRYQDRTIERYASLARVASAAIAPRLRHVPRPAREDAREARRRIDAPYQADLARALSAPPPTSAIVSAPLPSLTGQRSVDAVLKRCQGELLLHEVRGSYAAIGRGLRNLRKGNHAGQFP
jgi:hypothetical protein